MVINQIFQYLSRKQINNGQTLIPTKSAYDLFLEPKNISSVTINMYNSMAVLNRPEYFSYKDKIEKYMNEWIWKQKMPADDIDNEYTEYIVKRLNNNFINEHKYMIKKADVMYTDGQKLPNMKTRNDINYGSQYDSIYTIAPENVYKDQFQIVSRDNAGNLVKMSKAGKDMMPWDYQNWDVWKKQEVYADFDFEKFRSFRTKYGYVNDYRTIPRHVDRDPESFGLDQRDPFRASLTDTPRAYDNDEYYRAKGIVPRPYVNSNHQTVVPKTIPSAWEDDEYVQPQIVPR
jgi:hypothetical protein